MQLILLRPGLISASPNDVTSVLRIQCCTHSTWSCPNSPVNRLVAVVRSLTFPNGEICVHWMCGANRQCELCQSQISISPCSTHADILVLRGIGHRVRDHVDMKGCSHGSQFLSHRRYWCVGLRNQAREPSSPL